MKKYISCFIILTFLITTPALAQNDINQAEKVQILQAVSILDGMNNASGELLNTRYNSGEEALLIIMYNIGKLESYNKMIQNQENFVPDKDFQNNLEIITEPFENGIYNIKQGIINNNINQLKQGLKNIKRGRKNIEQLKKELDTEYDQST